MLVNEHTKIAALLKHHPQALETLVSLNPAFQKLRNPLLRKLMAGRTSIGMAARIGGCTTADFYRVLLPLGIKTAPETEKEGVSCPDMPLFLQQLPTSRLHSLDVRPLLAGGTDPLRQILAALEPLPAGEVLKIINTFEPTPLIGLLKKKGYAHWTAALDDKLYETYFFRQGAAATAPTPEPAPAAGDGDWQELLQRYTGRLQELDVRQLEMPQPMIRILETLETLEAGHALYVLHKRLPLYLLPELAQRGVEYRSRELSETDVHLLLFRP